VNPRKTATGRTAEGTTTLEQKGTSHWEAPATQNAEQAALRLAAIVESSDDAIVSKDLNGIVKSWNKAAERMFGYKAEEIIGKSITTIIPPELHSEEDLILGKVRKGEKIDHFQTVRRRKDGTSIDVSLTVSPIKDQTGNIIGAAKIARDITYQRKTEEAALKLAAIVESSDDAIVSKDLNGIVTSWNQAAERMFGYKPEEIIGKSITTIIPPDLYGDEDLILGRIRKGEKVEHFQTVRRRKDGSLLDVSLTVSPIKDQDGNVIGAAKIARDITHQRKTEAAALKLAAIVESSEDAIISKDLNGVVTSWNQAAERMFGYTAGEIIGLPITTIIPPELHGDEPRILAKIRAGERIEHFETIRVRKDGERLNISLTVSPIRDGSGKVIGAAKISRDVTQQKKLEAAIQISERLASVGRLAATVAHEINNPLEAVTNFIYLAKQQPGLSEKVMRYLNYADQELGRVAHIAQQTLGFYRDSSQPVLLPVAGLIEDVLTIYERKAKYKSVTIERRIEPNLNIYGLQGALKQVLSNLLANAIDASKERGRIIIHARGSRHFQSGKYGVKITIADNGSGIAAKDRARLFSPFFTTKKDVGTGLGLWITKDLLEKKGGYIRFRSRDKEPTGTAMCIYLPEIPPEKPAELVA
jgi:PAS domain S-box-containing protein